MDPAPNKTVFDNVKTFAHTDTPQEGRKVLAMDIAWGGESMDLMTPQGFLGAVYHATRLVPGSGCLAAPVCSSFVFLSIGQKPIVQTFYFCNPPHCLFGLLMASSAICKLHTSVFLLKTPYHSMMNHSVMRKLDIPPNVMTGVFLRLV
jgi:hypothetical protein